MNEKGKQKTDEKKKLSKREIIQKNKIVEKWMEIKEDAKGKKI